MSDTSLVFNILARDKATKTLAKVRASALHSSSGIKMALGPALQPVLAASTAGIVGLGAALVSAGAAVGVFGVIAGTAFTEVKEASDKTDELREKIRLLNQQARMSKDMDERAKFTKKAADATLELQARLALLPAGTREASFAYGQLKSDWLDFVDVNKPATFGIMTSGMQSLGSIIRKLQPLYDVGAAAAQRFVDALARGVKGGGVERFIGWLSSNAGPALNSLGTIGKNFGILIGNLFDRFDSGGQSILAWLAEASGRWAEWSKQTGSDGLGKWVTMVEESGPGVKQLLRDMGSAIKNIAQATAPLAPISLAVAGALAAILAALPPGVITTLVAAWIAYSVALKGYNAYVLLAGIGTKLWAGAQWLMNTALLASPITWVVLAVIALIAVIVLIATKTTWFQTAWNATWGAVKTAFSATLSFLSTGFLKWWAFFSGAWRAVGSFFATIGKNIAAYFTSMNSKILSGGTSMLKWWQSLPGKIRGALSNVFSPLWTGFKSALNRIIGGWNGLSFTIGGGSFMGMSVPSASFGTPNLPYLAKGGTIDRSGMAIVGERGPEVVSLSRGAQVTPLTGRNGAGGGKTVIEIRSGGSKLDDLLVEILRIAIANRGGKVQKVLGQGA